jgi:hypothetical protein
VETPGYDATSRKDVIDWLIGVMDTFSMLMSTRTGFFAAALVDSYLLRPKESRCELKRPEDLRLVAATCLYIASKCEDVSHVGIASLTFQAEDSAGSNFDSVDILLTEESILNALDFDIYLPTVIDHLHIFLSCIPELNHDPRLASFAKYMAEIGLL